MSTTPRTDAARLTEPYLVRELSFEVVRAEVMEELETELAAVTAERDALKANRVIELFQMAGYLSAELPALHAVEAGEIARAVDAWIKRDEKDMSGL